MFVSHSGTTPAASGPLTTPGNHHPRARRLAGAAAFLLSVFAITSGVDRARVWGASDVSARRARDAYVAWMVAVFVSTAVLEIGRARERRDAPRGATHEEIKEVELADA